MEDHGINNDILNLHCRIHQEALCAKILILKSVIDIVVKAVSFVLFRGLNHRQLRQLLVQAVVCIEICFIFAMYVGLVEVKCYKECKYREKKQSYQISRSKMGF